MAGAQARLPLVRFHGNLAEVEVRLWAAGAAVERRLAAAGLELIGAYPKYGRVVGRCPLERLDEIAAIPEVSSVHPTYRPRTQTGSVTSQGDASIHADDARFYFGVDGTGVKVGVLSDSFHSTIGGTTSAAVCATASGDLPVEILTGSMPQSSGDLPAEVTVLDNCAAGGFCSSGETDEGAALAEIIHDLAPGAEILFHTAFRSEADFAEGISELAACGAQVVVDDVLWPAEPMFQDGIIAQEVQAAVDGGVAYFSSAGNQAGFGVDQTYSDSDAENNDDEEFPTTGVDLHAFGAGNRFASITIPPGCGVELILQWNQPFSGTLGAGAANDLDLYLCRTEDGAQALPPDPPHLLGCDPEDEVNGALASSADVQGCGFSAGDPFEILSYSNASGSPVTGYMAVEHYCGDKADVRFRIVTLATGGCSLATSGYSFEAGIFDQAQIYGHTAAVGAHAVAAVFYGEIDLDGMHEPPTWQIDVKPSSSLGGDLPFYFDDAGIALTGAPVTRSKPDLAAPEGTNTSFFGVDIAFDPDSFPNFFGTSAAAPHAAAVAALMLDRYPALTEPEIRAILSSAATDIEDAGADPLSGSGLVDAHQALVETPYSLVGTDPAGLDFGLIEVGTSSTEEIVVSNTGLADLHVSSISSSDPAVFSASAGGTNPCSSLTPTIQPGLSCTIEVTYSPSEAEHQESLTIQSDSAVDRSKIVTLTGTAFRNCTSEDHRVLPEPPGPISGVVTEEACVSLTAGPYAIGPTGDVTFVVGDMIVLRDGFSAAGTFKAVIDPLLP